LNNVPFLCNKLFFKKGDTIQGGTSFKGGHYLRKYGTYLEDGTLTKAESINLGEEVAKGTTLFLCWGESISKGSRIRLGDTSI
jgi:hypothetical protein